MYLDLLVRPMSCPHGWGEVYDLYCSQPPGSDLMFNVNIRKNRTNVYYTESIMSLPFLCCGSVSMSSDLGSFIHLFKNMEDVQLLPRWLLTQETSAELLNNLKAKTLSPHWGAFMRDTLFFIHIYSLSIIWLYCVSAV